MDCHHGRGQRGDHGNGVAVFVVEHGASSKARSKPGSGGAVIGGPAGPASVIDSRPGYYAFFAAAQRNNVPPFTVHDYLR